jgi:hypothetical protein
VGAGLGYMEVTLTHEDENEIVIATYKVKVYGGGAGLKYFPAGYSTFNFKMEDKEPAYNSCDPSRMEGPASFLGATAAAPRVGGYSLGMLYMGEGSADVTGKVKKGFALSMDFFVFGSSELTSVTRVKK